MRKDIFASMKEQMMPDPALEAALHYGLESRKRPGFSGYILRWVPAAVSVVVAGFLVFNLAMPAAAEQLPVVGKAFESLNNAGKKAREEGKTPTFLIPEKEEEPFSLSLSYGECNGLDLVFKIELEDRQDTVTKESDTLVLSGVAVDVMGTYLYPANENPRLTRAEDGVFRGLATFNASPVASLISEGETEAVLYCRDISAYVEGATYEEVISLYTYDYSAAEEFCFNVDLSELEINYLGLENEGITIEYLLKTDERTDVIYSVDPSVEYAKSFSVYTSEAAPSLISTNSVKDENGRYCYSATFEGGDALNSETADKEKEAELYVDAPFYVYSHATGEYIIIEEHEEVEE